MSDMSFTQAAEEVRKMLRGFKAVEQVAEAMEQAGSVQNAVKEADKAIADKRKELESLDAQLIVATKEVSDAKEEAKRTVSEATKKASDKLKKADEDLAGKIAKFDADILGKKAELAKLAEDEKAAFDNVAKLKLELADVEAKITKAKAGIAKLLNG